ncbi:MAG: hypothetical protein C4345_01350, partial [Chloroflexota bacterium]
MWWHCVGRAPRWPTGIVGSITHSDTPCIVAVARHEAVCALGVDAELAQPHHEAFRKLLVLLLIPEKAMHRREHLIERARRCLPVTFGVSPSLAAPGSFAAAS